MSENTSDKPEPDLTSDIETGASRFTGRLRRNAGLLTVVVVVLLVGPAITRMLNTYRAMVLDVKGEQMLIAFPKKPPDWVDKIDVQPGDMILKEAGDWDPKKTERIPADRDLVSLYERYQRAYTGTIIKINKPVTAGGNHTAVIALDGGGKVFVPLVTEHLQAAAVNRRVRKSPGDWDPELLDEFVEPSPEGEQQPVPPEPTPTP